MKICDTHLVECGEGKEVSKKYQAETERESRPLLYVVRCHGILGPLGYHIYAPDAIKPLLLLSSSLRVTPIYIRGWKCSSKNA